MSYKTTILYIVMGGAQNTTAQRALLKQSAADLRLPIHAVMMGDEGDHRPVSFVSSEASGVDGAVVMTAHAPSAARLIANGCPTIYCHNEAIWADSAPWRIIVRSGEEVPAALAENPRPLPPKPIQAQPKVAGVGSVINLVGRGEPIEPIPAGRVTFAKPLPKNSKVAERATRIKMSAQESRSCDLDMDLLRYAMMTGDASAEPAEEGAKKPKRERALPKKQLYPLRDENGVIWVSKTKKITPRFIRLYAPIAKSVARAIGAGNSVVLKPAEQSPLSALRLAELAAEAGVPIHRDPATARDLYATVAIGQDISQDHFRAVAAAIRFDML